MTSSLNENYQLHTPQLLISKSSSTSTTITPLEKFIQSSYEQVVYDKEDQVLLLL